MTIKKKIRLSNIMMVLILILFTTIVLIVCLNTSLGSCWHTFMDIYSDENGVQFAQSMIYNYDAEISAEYTKIGTFDATEEFVTAVEENPVLEGWGNKIIQISKP